MGRLFGTDGARGIANKELNCELAMNIGRAAAYVLTEKTTEKPKVLIGKDTRVSSNMLEMALAAGLCSVGAVFPCKTAWTRKRKPIFSLGLSACGRNIRGRAICARCWTLPLPRATGWVCR